MRARDIEALQSVSAPTIAPDGSRVVVSVAHPSLDADATVGQLWTVPLDGAPARRLTRGRRDSSPQYSPDGRAIAFTRAEKDAAPQLFVVDSLGGEPVQLTDAKLGIESFSWSPGSERITYAASVPDQGRYGTVEGISPGSEPARHITTLVYKYNGTGYTGDQRPQVFVVDVPTLDAEPEYVAAPQTDGTTPEVALVPISTQLTSGDYSWYEPAYVGERIVAASARHAGRDHDLLNQLWVVAEEPEPLFDAILAIEAFSSSVDGTVYLIAQDLGPSGADFVGRNSAVYRLDGDAPVRLTDPEVTDFTGSSLTVVGDRVLVPGIDRGRAHLYEVLVSSVRTISSGDVEITAAAASSVLVVVTYQSPTSFGDVALLDDGALTPLTDFSTAIRESGLVPPVELTVTARDGYPVHGWVARPAGEGKHIGKYPTLLMIHGGPYTQYGIHLFDETQVYVDAGYAVVYCNPRGSAGYGQAHGQAIREDMGGLDMNDVLDFLEGAISELGDLDETRLGILGGSYGGYLTAWTIAHDHRFKAAIVERGYLDPPAFIGSSDIGMNFPQQYNGADRELQRRQSPQEVAHLVTTPTLVIHSEQDLRCPLAQAETYYTTLKLQGTDAELLIFPGENHELSRAGKPRHRVQRFDAILDWFGRHL